MSNFFNIENPVFQFINKVIDLIMLSFFWTICAIPGVFMGYAIFKEGGYILYLALFVIAVIPLGPATTALYYAVVKVIRRERGYAAREFFRSFRANFKQGMLICIILGVLASILYIDYEYVNALEEESTFNMIMTVAFNVVTALTLFLIMFIFPVLSRFKLPLKHLFKNSMIMALRHLLTTILVLLIVAVFAFGTWLLWPYPTFLLFPGVCCFLCSLLIEKVFKKYMPGAEENPEDSGVDQWYLE